MTSVHRQVLLGRKECAERDLQRAVIAYASTSLRHPLRLLAASRRFNRAAKMIRRLAAELLSTPT